MKKKSGESDIEKMRMRIAELEARLDKKTNYPSATYKPVYIGAETRVKLHQLKYLLGCKSIDDLLVSAAIPIMEAKIRKEAEKK
jgi:hypothetical protein